MTEPGAKREAIRANYDAFEALLPLLLTDHEGQFALLHDQAIAGFFPTAGEAQAVGITTFADGLFSVQRVEEKAIDLGFYSHARYQRIA